MTSSGVIRKARSQLIDIRNNRPDGPLIWVGGGKPLGALRDARRLPSAAHRLHVSLKANQRFKQLKYCYLTQAFRLRRVEVTVRLRVICTSVIPDGRKTEIRSAPRSN